MTRLRLRALLTLCAYVLLALQSCSNKAEQPIPEAASQVDHRYDSLRSALTSYVASQPADVGFAMLAIEDGDTISVNGDKMHSLMSVTKFPQALLLLHLVDQGKVDMAKPLTFTPEHLTQRTASTLVKDHPQKSFALSIPEVLRYAVGQSDNISSNVMFDAEGGPDAVTKYLREIGISDITIGASYRDPQALVEKNIGTPRALVSLLKKFYSDKLLSDTSQQLLWKTMVGAVSGPDRIKGQLPAGTIVAHKTGTSGTDSTGAITALNDVGIITLPNGKRVAIALLVGNSKAGESETPKIIATISRMVWDEFVRQP